MAKRETSSSAVLNAPAKGEGHPGYKYTKLGWIPEEWEVEHLGNIIEIRNGQVDPKDPDFNQMTLVAPNHIESGTGRLLEKVTALEQDAISGKYYVESGQVIYSKIRPYLRKAVLADEDCLCSADAYPISGKEQLDNRFLLLTALSERFTYYAVSASGRTGIPKVNREDLSDFIVALPPLTEQRRIAAVLGAWDRAIATVQQLLAAQQDRKRGLMQELLTGRKRFKGFGGKWRPTRFDEIFSPKKEKAGTHEYEVLSVTTKGLVSQAEYFDRKVASEDRSNYLVVRKGDFVFSGLNFWMGSVDLVWDFEVGIISPAYKCFVVDQAVMHLDYARWFVRSQVMLKALVKSSIQGASIVRRNLDGEQLAAWLFDLPEKEEQRMIAHALTACDLEVRSLEQELDHLTTQKRGLMQQLLTGAVRVKV